MARGIERIEVYVDRDEKAVQVLRTPPFRIRIDTLRLPDGPHTLRIVTVHQGGGREERNVRFEVDNVPSSLIEGLDDGDVVRGEINLEVKVGDYELPLKKSRSSLLLYLGSVVAVLGGVWLFFAFTPPAGRLIAAMAPPGATAQGTGQQKTPVDSTLYAAGKKTYDQYCTACHQANGKGIDDSFPPLAGNTNLTDLGLVVTTVHDGKSGHATVEGKTFNATMPPIGSGFSAKEIAEVATYIRNSWGNSFGGVTIEEVQKYLSGGSAGGS